MANTHYDLEYRYNIQWMIDNYGLENLDMDDFLVTLVTLKACSLYYMDQGDPGLSETYRDYLTQLINLFNSNTNPLDHSKPTILGGLGLSAGAQ